MDALNTFCQVYSNQVLTIGINALLALSIWRIAFIRCS